MTQHGPSDSERQEREWLEGLRYEDKFPDDPEHESEPAPILLWTHEGETVDAP
jgi:hypothetical protein